MQTSYTLYRTDTGTWGKLAWKYNEGQKHGAEVSIALSYLTSEEDITHQVRVQEHAVIKTSKKYRPTEFSLDFEFQNFVSEHC